MKRSWYKFYFGNLSKKKRYEIEIGINNPYQKKNTWFNLVLNWNKKVDHAGIYFEFFIPIFYINFSIYDIRHWDDERGEWMPVVDKNI